MEILEEDLFKLQSTSLKEFNENVLIREVIK